jgi:homoserine dehydrogenase
VVADVAEIAWMVKSGARRPGIQFAAHPPEVMGIEDVMSRYYFRFSALDRPGVLSRIAGIFGDHGISISGVIQKGRREGEAVPLVMLTHMARERDVRTAVEKIKALDVVAGEPYYIRVEGE